MRSGARARSGQCLSRSAAARSAMASGERQADPQREEHPRAHDGQREAHTPLRLHTIRHEEHQREAQIKLLLNPEAPCVREGVVMRRGRVGCPVAALLAPRPKANIARANGRVQPGHPVFVHRA
eukprot:5788154-Prymnesium_polylepis.1